MSQHSQGPFGLHFLWALTKFGGQLAQGPSVFWPQPIFKDINAAVGQNSNPFMPFFVMSMAGYQVLYRVIPRVRNYSVNSLACLFPK